jgi:hypothetical protein
LFPFLGGIADLPEVSTALTATLSMPEDKGPTLKTWAANNQLQPKFPSVLSLGVMAPAAARKDWAGHSVQLQARRGIASFTMPEVKQKACYLGPHIQPRCQSVLSIEVLVSAAAIKYWAGRYVQLEAG